MSGARGAPAAGPARVVVIGAGVAGTGAAVGAAHAGARVTVMDGGCGASALATGAIDCAPWQSAPAPAPDDISRAVKAVLDDLGGYRVPDRGSLLLTTSGIVRPARGHDAALMDVSSISTRPVGVVRCDRPGWHADALARAWGEGYVPFDVTVLRHTDEGTIPDADFAARHDDDARLGWLAERLRAAVAQAGGVFGGIVLPPSLGVDRARAEVLTGRAGIPCGEAIGMPGGPAGLRFERARDRAFASSSIERVRARAAAVQRADVGWNVTTEDGATFEAGAVILATGGLLGGGIEYSPSEGMHATALPPHSRPPFRLTVEAPLVLGSKGRRFDLPGSLFGLAPESLAWPFARDALLDRAGVLVDGDGRSARGPFAAGELVADAPHTWLGALASGVRAGAAASRVESPKQD